MSVEESLGNKSLMIGLSVWLLYQILLPTSRWLGNLLLKFLQEKLKIKYLSLNLIQGILRNLLLLFLICSSFYISSKIPKDIVNFGDNTYIKRDKQNKELIIYTNGIPQLTLNKDGLKVNKDLKVTGDIYMTDYFIDARDISPDVVLNILKSHKGVTELKKEIAKETSKEVIDSLKTEGIIKTPPK